MSGGSPAVFAPGVMADPLSDRTELDTRFGRIQINPQQAITFPTGLLGMPGRLSFCLARFPSEKMERFSILQSMDNPDLAFITLPVGLENPLIDREDLVQAARDLELPQEDLAALLIVSVQREAGSAKMTVNARAPVLIRLSLKVAAQYVFPHTKYLIRQPLSL